MFPHRTLAKLFCYFRTETSIIKDNSHLTLACISLTGFSEITELVVFPCIETQNVIYPKISSFYLSYIRDVPKHLFIGQQDFKVLTPDGREYAHSIYRKAKSSKVHICV